MRHKSPSAHASEGSLTLALLPGPPGSLEAVGLRLSALRKAGMAVGGGEVAEEHEAGSWVSGTGGEALGEGGLES